MDATTVRAPDTAGQLIRVVRFYDLVTGEERRGDIVAAGSHPACFQRLTGVNGVTAAGDYPASGTVGTGSSGTTLKLAGTPDFEVPGLLVVITAASSGAGLGQWRLVKNIATDVVTVDGWAGGYVPANGDSYELLIDCRGRSTLLVRTEFEANDSTCVLVPVFFDHSRTPSLGAAADDGQLGLDTVRRAPIQYLGREMYAAAQTRTVGDLGGSGAYFIGQTQPEDCRGAIGAKLWLKTAPGASKKVSAYACAV